MKLITEMNDDINVIVEDAEDGQAGSLYIEGIFMQAERANRNGRIYPASTLMREVKRYNNEFVSTGRAMGELGHPDNPQVNLDRVSHVITELSIRDNDIYGKAKITASTPCGKIAKGLLGEGIKLGVSSRGIGSLKKKGQINEVQNDFRLAAVDIVSDPSAPDAFVNGILEGKDWVMNNDGQFIEEELARTKGFIVKSTARQVEEFKFQLFENFVNALKGHRK